MRKKIGWKKGRRYERGRERKKKKVEGKRIRKRKKRKDLDRRWMSEI